MTDKLHTSDKALLHAAETGEGCVPLTPGLMEEIRDNLKTRFADIERRYPTLVDECPYETRLAVTQWVMKHLVEHAKEGGTYRYLIYQRLGFGPDAYVPLCKDGLTISNEFELPEVEEV